MDSTLDDFFNEINQIAPPPSKVKQSKSECNWQECYDENSGYPYYWNVKTNEVTWEVPEAYKLWKEKSEKSSKNNLFIPPQTSNLLPSKEIRDNLKIYKLESEEKIISSTYGPKNQEIVKNKTKGKTELECNTKESNRKSILLTSYGEDSESEHEDDSNIKQITGNTRDAKVYSPEDNQHTNSETSDSENDEIDLLTKIQKQAEVLKQLGGEIPPDVKNLVENTSDNESPQNPQISHGTRKKELTGYSLVAGYGNSDDEEEEIKNCFPIAENDDDKLLPVADKREPLFPIINPIDSKRPSLNEREYPEITTNLENKQFQRKRRIGIEFTTQKLPLQSYNLPQTEHERAGFGFKSSEENVSETESKREYSNFKSGGILFVKSGVLNPSQTESSSNKADKKEEPVEKIENEELQIDKKKMLNDIEEIQETLAEKLGFLSEGREAPSAVQILYIQMETLNNALKASCLSPKYLLDWLKETCSTLIKLEQGAAPNGWSLEWDRSNKRYYYYNQQTGESQWEYPQPDVIRSDEAMDISTTPPPPPDEQLPEQPPPPPTAPPPPSISRESPSPPPPPDISTIENSKIGASKTLSTKRSTTFAEPLPPGVDFSELAQNTPPPPPPTIAVTTTKTDDSMGQELNFFYSDIAALENQTANSAIPPSLPPPASENLEDVKSVAVDDPPKKKKKKVKIAQGLSLKKKGVSKLVEKWKNVQKDLND